MWWYMETYKLSHMFLSRDDVITMSPYNGKKSRVVVLK